MANGTEQNWIERLPMPTVTLILLALILFSPGQSSIPPADRDEPRFAQASRQMVLSGDYVDISYLDTKRYKKPVGIYWLQSTAVHLFSSPEAKEIWAYRLPSAIGAALAMLATYWTGLILVGRGAATAAAVMLGSALLLGVEARLAKTDAMLLAMITLSQFVLAKAYLGFQEGQRLAKRWTSLFWIAQGAGILIKGPIAPMVTGLTALALVLSDGKRTWLSQMRPRVGLGIVGAMVLPWLMLITIASDGAFFRGSLGEDFVPKILAGVENHGAPPGTFLLSSFLTLWPWSLFVWLSLPWLYRRRDRAAGRFLLAWVIPTWIVFELVPTKLVHYVMPTFPALTIAAAAFLEDLTRRDVSWEELRARARGWTDTILTGAVTTIWAVASVALAAVLVAFPYVADNHLSAPGLVAGIAVMVTAGLGVGAVWRGQLREAVGPFLIGSVVIYWMVYGALFPSLQSIWVSRELAEAIREEITAPEPAVVMVGYHEPSAVFLLGTNTILMSDDVVEGTTGISELSQQAGAKAYNLLIGGLVDVAVVEADQVDAFNDMQAVIDSSEAVVRFATVTGVNYSKGMQPVELALFRRRAPGEAPRTP